ncbi:MAG TPA: protein kinase, partial [Pirellulales bacterium]|nr:protein kinase [Pirellulales bacterium]
MNPCCSQAMLEAALSEELPPDDESRLTRHLEQCDACSAALERLAGGPAWCREAASLLAEDELDSAASREQWSEIDFTVDHLEPADDPSVLGRLGEYDVLEVIGHGGMGVVLKGFDRQLKRCVAIKVLAPHLAYNAAAKKRFAREAQAAAAVMHPNVIAIHQVQSAGRLPFLVMPLVAGESLADRLARQGPLELKEILRIGMQAAAGLAAAHEQGLVHRDVKPANILLEKGVERAVLTDFGLARAADDATLTRWGIVAGTPQYMSPEQARGEALDGRSDLFSLGCVLYEIATGVSPFRAGSMVATMRRLVDEPHQAMASLNAELPPWFITIVDRLLEKEPARRFASAREVSDLLEECLAHVQQPAIVPLPVGLPKSPSRHVWRLPRFSKLGLKGVLAMISALGAAVLGLFLYTADPPDIAGDWTSDEWGRVTLKQTADGEYQGTYTDTFGKQPGEIELKWSRIERRFNGTWREGQDRFGEISVRLAGDEIRGAFTTDEKSKLNPGTPHLVDLAWTRAAAPAAFKRPDASELSHRVPFELGAKLMRDGDRITIEEVRGTADTMKAGNYYEIKGTYRLASRDKATLAAYVTSETENVKNAGQSDTPTVTRGEGRFDLLLHMTHEGKPHVSFYPAETREGFAHVYFGTGDSVLKQGWWEHPAKNEKHKEKLDLLPSTTINVFSADGSLIGSAPGRPISPIEGWWPSVLIEDRKTKTGIGLADLALTTSDEDALIAETNRVPPLEVKALAFSPDGKTIAVGTSVGQIKLFEPRTGKLLMTLDDEKARLSDSRTPEKLKGLRRAIGDVTELAFSPDGSLL